MFLPSFLCLSLLCLPALLFLSSTPYVSTQYVNITADNTFEVFLDNVALISPLCPDNQTGETGSYNPPGVSCFWGNVTRVKAINLVAGSVVAVHAHNSGKNTDPFLGGLNPGAFILTITANDGSICSNTDLSANWICTDDLALLQYTNSSTPPSNWKDPAYTPQAPLWGGPLTDLGLNAAGSWATLTTAAVAPATWPNSIWYDNIPGGPMPVPGISTKAHWVWYRNTLPNEDVYCRVTIGTDQNCTVPSRSPTPSLSLSASVSLSSTGSLSVSSSSSPSISLSRTKSVSFSISLSPSLSLSSTQSISFSLSASVSLSSTGSLSLSSSSSPTISFSNTPSSSITPTSSPSPAVAAGGGGSNTGVIVGAVVGSVAGAAALAGLAAAGAAAGIIAYKKSAGAPSSTGVNSGSAMFNDVKQSDLYTGTQGGYSNPLFAS